MKTIKQTLAIILLVTLGLQSCSSKKDEKIKDETLSGFMLGGIYFINGFGGLEVVDKNLSNAGYTSKKQIVGGYKQTLEFAFQKSQASDMKSLFSNMWEVKNKEEYLKITEDLKTKKNDHKSWDYARIINNNAMAFACDWLTKEEVLKINSEVLVLARKDYKTWTEYYADFKKGRDAWDDKDPQKAAFDKTIDNLTKKEKAIYNILPLN